MLGEVSQTQKDKYNITSLICGIYKSEQTKQNIDTQIQRIDWKLSKARLGFRNMDEGDLQV